MLERLQQKQSEMELIILYNIACVLEKHLRVSLLCIMKDVPGCIVHAQAEVWRSYIYASTFILYHLHYILESRKERATWENSIWSSSISCIWPWCTLSGWYGYCICMNRCQNIMASAAHVPHLCCSSLILLEFWPTVAWQMGRLQKDSGHIFADWPRSQRKCGLHIVLMFLPLHYFTALQRSAES